MITDPWGVPTRTRFTNLGASQETALTLPTAVARSPHKSIFINESGFGMRIVAPGGQRIQLGTAQTSTGGYIRATQVGSYAVLESTGNSPVWVVTALAGNWFTDLGAPHSQPPQNDITSSGAITVDPTITTGAAFTGQTLILKQNAGGTATWASTIGNARLPGGTFAKSLAGNAIDSLTFRYNSLDSKWDLIGVALALS